MARFRSLWQRNSDSERTGARIKGGLKSSEPIKTRLELATRQIQQQVIRLDQTIAKLKEKDRSIFSSIVTSIQRNDDLRANMLASELMEIRKMRNIATQLKLALEQLTLRLTTVTDLGDLAATLSPALDSIKNIRPGIASLIPDAEHEIGEVSGLLSELVVEAGQVNTPRLDFETANEDAEKLLVHAAVLADQRERSKFAEVQEQEYEDALE